MGDFDGKHMEHGADISLKGSSKTEYRPADFQPCQQFPQFSKLPLELRLIIWTLTWPASRMIEVAICEDETVLEEYEEVAILHFAGSLITMLEYDFGSRIVQEQSQYFHSPVSLQICYESRTHTLSHYRHMEHTVSKQGSFYFNPDRDVLWLSQDFTDEPQYMRDLIRCYGAQLNHITTLLAEECELEYTPWRFEPFKGLKTILLLLDDHYSHPEEYSDVDDNDEGTEDVEGVAIGSNNNEKSNQQTETETANFDARLERLKKCAKILKHVDRTLWCIERSGELECMEWI